MRSINKSASLWLAIVAALAAASPAQSPYDEIVGFGDSMCDDGNLYAATGNAFPPAPNFDGRFSNGPIWVELLPELLDSANPPALANEAWAGARTNATNGNAGVHAGAKGMATQVADYLAANPTANPTALYVLWGGFNDYLGGGATSPTNPGQTGPVDNLSAHISALATAGANSFLVLNLPDLGATPLGAGSPIPATLSARSAAFNAALAAELDDLRTNLGVDIRELDAAALYAAAIADPGSLGFVDASSPCFNDAVPSVCPNPDDFFYWDSIHPSAAADEAIAEAAALELQGATPAESWNMFE